MLWKFREVETLSTVEKTPWPNSGVSKFSGEFRNKPLTVAGVDASGIQKPILGLDISRYLFNGVQTSGYNIIKSYYSSYYPMETANYITDVKLLILLLHYL